MLKKTYFMLFLLFVCLFTVKVQAVGKSYSTTDKIEEYSNPDTIDTSNLIDENSRVRFYAKTLGSTEIDERFNLVVTLKDYYSGDKIDITLDYNNPAVIKDIPCSKYMISITSSDSTHESTLNSELMTFDSPLMTYCIDVEGISPNDNEVSENTETEVEQNWFLRFFNDNVIVLLLLLASIGILLYRKFVLKK